MARPEPAASAGDFTTHRIVACLVIVVSGLVAAVTLRAEPVSVTVVEQAAPQARTTVRVEPGGERSACASCHAFSVGSSHPIDVEPAGAVPADLPLTDGRVSCLTCHDESATEPHENRGGRRGPMLRRDPDTQGLCAACHSAGTTDRRFHGSAFTRAHTASDARSRYADSALDADSNACLSCHDGTVAGDAGRHVTSIRAGTAFEHPLGVELLTKNAGRPDEVRFVSAASLDPRIRLFNGKVGCLSCHSVYSKHEKLLVMSNARSALCMSCHVE